MMGKVKGNRPLLRGILIDVAGWFPHQTDPTLERAVYTIAVWCPWCGGWHHHGWQPEDDGRVETHRAAHCHDGKSPFKSTGYWISVLRPSDPGSKLHAVKPGKEVTRRARKRIPHATGAARPG